MKQCCPQREYHSLSPEPLPAVYVSYHHECPCAERSIWVRGCASVGRKDQGGHGRKHRPPPVEAGQTCSDTRSEAARTVTQEAWGSWTQPVQLKPTSLITPSPNLRGANRATSYTFRRRELGAWGQKAVTY